MGILRTDVVSHSQLEGSGSVELDGVGDYLTFGSHSAFSPATADVTIELWVYLTDGTNLSSGNYYLFDMGSNGYRIQIYNGSIYWASAPGDNDYVGPIGNVLSNNTWHHIAGVRDNNSLELYVDGVHLGSKATTASITSTSFTIGSYSTGGGDYEPYGYISNFRYVRGVVYKNNFTPPKFELKNIPGTIVLGCQSTTSATDFAVTPSTVTANGDAAASAFHPGLKKDITDTGVVFDGVTTFDSQAYFVPPGGNTRERNRGRGLLMGGAVSPGATNTTQIKYFNIAAGGITEDFGQTTVARRSTGSFSSSTRALMGGGFVSPTSPAHTISDVIDFVTIANTANAIDFGDMQSTGYAYGTASNETRGLFAGGYRPNNSAVVNTIDLITIATAGNASNFADLTRQVRSFGGFSSSTRGVFAGGTYPAVQDVIDFVTFASQGVDASDFGNLTDARDHPYGASSSTRGVMGGGRDPNTTNIIDFITIASTGNAIDFGDLSSTSYYFNAATANSTRAVWIGNSSITNAAEFVTIATTGNAVDFGDQNGTAQHSNGACSDSHGGLE